MHHSSKWNCALHAKSNLILRVCPSNLAIIEISCTHKHSDTHTQMMCTSHKHVQRTTVREKDGSILYSDFFSSSSCWNVFLRLAVSRRNQQTVYTENQQTCWVNWAFSNTNYDDCYAMSKRRIIKSKWE